MADTVLKIIPINHEFVPDLIAQDKAVTYIKSQLGEDLKVSITKNVEFIDQGQNFENVFCNVCNQKIETEVWQDSMGEACNTNFNNLNFVTPCCSAQTSLNNLIYNMPAGFSIFSLVIDNPLKGIDEEHLAYLQSLLQVELKIIWARY